MAPTAVEVAVIEIRADRRTVVFLAFLVAALLATIMSLWIAGGGGAGLRDQMMPGPICPPLC
jgi:hypothetical protein